MEQVRLLLRHAGSIDPISAEAYAAVGGYQALKRAVDAPEDLCQTVKAAGLRGRGGAGFPVGLKWEMTRNIQADQKYIVCNADEGEPGTNKDRVLLSQTPHAVLEGMAVAGAAAGATKGFIYLRAEYPYVRDVLQKAIESARAAGYLGKNLFGSRVDFDVELRTGQGAYICGEETALLASIEGKRGEPRLKPPFPGVSGLWSKPTIINNVESMANVPLILNMGPEVYRQYGTEKYPGTKLFTLSGCVCSPGVYEFPAGVTIRQMLDAAGGPLGTLKAVQTGGASGPIVSPALLDTPMDPDSCAAVGASFGTGDLMFIGEDTSLVDLGRNLAGFFASESCGKCTPCRLGTRRMERLMTQLLDGTAPENVLEELENLSEYIRVSALCGLGQAAVQPVLSLLKNFRPELEAAAGEQRKGR